MENLVAVGGFVLEPGNAGGTSLSRDQAATASAEPLERAFAAAAPTPDRERGSAFAAEVEDASATTAKIERAVALCKGVGEGRALDPAQLGLEVGALLDCLERLDRKKEHKSSLRMARALATLLMLLKRWMDLLRTLRTALRAAEQLGDEEAIAWAEHELGTLRVVAGDLEAADRDLCRAREIRERIGDRRGLAATERNMATLCERLRSMLRQEELVRRGARDGRAPMRMLAFAGAFALFFGGGLAAGAIVGGDSGGNATAERTAGPGGEPATEVDAVESTAPATTETTPPTATGPTTTETAPPTTETTPPTTEVPTETASPSTTEVPPPVANTAPPPPLPVEEGPIVK